MINTPVLHVNGDYPEGIVIRCAWFYLSLVFLHSDVVRAMDIAFRYRKYFRKVCDHLIIAQFALTPFQQDIIVDLLVYRRWYVH
jgi:probable 2-oxoglutarate dehydrogenase E1 component DHKTD1